MKLLLKILLLIFTMLFTTVGEVKSSTVANVLQEETPIYLFQETRVFYFGFENYFNNSCVNEEKAVTCSEQVLSTKTVVAKGGKTFFEGAKYSDKVIRQMNKVDDIRHAFPKSVDGYATKYGQWSTKTGGDGKVYQWLELSGNYRGKTGTFEYIRNPITNEIDHRFFKIIP